MMNLPCLILAVLWAGAQALPAQTPSPPKKLSKKERKRQQAAEIQAELQRLDAAAAQAATRAQFEDKIRDEKQRLLTPDQLSKTEETLNTVQDRRLVERFTEGVAGVRIVLGGLYTGSGFAFGPEYVRTSLGGTNWDFKATARTSTRLWQLYAVELARPESERQLLFAGIRAQHRNYSSLQYYGTGPESSRDGRSNYRLEDTTVEGNFGIKPIQRFRVSGSTGLLQVNVGPGQRKNWASSDATFRDIGEPARPGRDAVAPGITNQTDFLRSGFLVDFDWRDIPGTPRQGGRYTLRHNWFHDLNGKGFAFRRLDLEAQQYFGFFNDRRVIALRAKTAMTFKGAGQSVPFYLQPTVGGSDELRGYRPFRFTGDNSLSLTAEYRWEAFTGLDMAIFADAGKVAISKDDLNLKELESSVGFGLRFNVRNQVFMRIDTGFSHEGFQVWVKFNNVF